MPYCSIEKDCQMTDQDPARLLPLLNALFEGQRRTLGMVEAAINKFSSVETEITKLNRKVNGLQESTTQQIGGLEELMVRHHHATTGRLDALATRLEDTERLLDDRARDMKSAQIDLAGQYNDILTALQNSSHALRLSEENSVRINELEQRLGPHG